MPQPVKITVRLTETSTENVLNGSLQGEQMILEQAPDSLDFDLVQYGSSGGNLQIPTPRVAISNPAIYPAGEGIKNLSPFIGSDIPPNIYLSWAGHNGATYEWLNYTPRYYLFYRKKFSKRHISITGTYVPRPGGWRLPNMVGAGITPLVSNLSNNSTQGRSISDRGTQWTVPPTPFKPLNISSGTGEIDFNPNQYFARRLYDTPGEGTFEYNQRIFPMYWWEWLVNVRRIGVSNYFSYTPDLDKMRKLIPKTLKVRFAIGILVDGRLVFGPMSDAVTIYPRSVYDVKGNLFYYGWGARLR